jgi:hypothetical protein
MLGIEADEQPLLAAHGLEYGGQFLEVPPDGPASTSRVLDKDRTLRGAPELGRRSVERTKEPLSDLLKARFETAATMTADVQHEARGPHRIGSRQVSGKHGVRALEDPGIVACEVDEVGGVTERCAYHSMVGLRFGIPRQELGIDPPLPRARTLGEDLDHLGAHASTCIEGVDEGGTTSHVRAEQHG